MRRGWTAAVASFAVLATSLVGLAIWTDRERTLTGVKERTHSVARMIAAHGDAAISDATSIISAIESQIDEWDLEDPARGRELLNTVRQLILDSPTVSSAWVTDGDGITRLDPWSFPPQPTDTSGQRYYRRHLAGETGPLVIGGDEASAADDREQFTVSRSLYAPDGSLRAVVAVGIFSGQYDALYAEAVTWPDARAGLYSFTGDVLARLRTGESASPAFTAELQLQVRRSGSGSAMMLDGGAQRLASWHRSQRFPDVFGASSQSIGTALADWRRRSALLAAIGALAVLGFAGFAVVNVRAGEAREAARYRDIAIREVHHRVKNALQLIVSMMTLRARRSGPAVRAELERISIQVRAIADVEDLLQNSSLREDVDICALLGQLCERMTPAFGGEIRFESDGDKTLDAARATSVAIVVNELVMNAIKHGRSLVEVTCLSGGRETIAITVRDDGPGLPDGFDLARSDRFGLTAARTIARSIQGELTAGGNGPAGGAVFRLTVPAA